MCEVNNFQYAKNERKAGGDNKKFMPMDMEFMTWIKAKLGLLSRVANPGLPISMRTNSSSASMTLIDLGRAGAVCH